MPVTEGGTFRMAGMGSGAFRSAVTTGATTKAECQLVNRITTSFTVLVIRSKMVGGGRGRITRFRRRV